MKLAHDWKAKHVEFRCALKVGKQETDDPPVHLRLWWGRRKQVARSIELADALDV